MTHANNKDAVKLIYSSLVLIAKIFYSLNFQVSVIRIFYVHCSVVNDSGGTDEFADFTQWLCS